MKATYPGVSDLAVTILNIDDNEASLYVKSRLLRSEGYNVIEGSTGSDALSLASKTKPQLALVDVKLPDMSGLEVCRALKSNPYTKPIMVLLVSALATRSEDRVAGLEDGADGYLTEPTEPKELLAMVRALLRLHRQEQKLSSQARLLEMTHDIIVMRDTEDRIIYWNRGAESLYGWSQEQALGKISHELFKTECTVPIEEIRATLKRDGHWRGELVHVVREGRRIIVDSHQSQEHDLDGKLGTVLEINTDITERRRGEEALRLSEAKLREFAGQQENLVGERTRELLQSQTRLRALAMELGLAEQHERERLVRELHDYLGQLLALSQIKLDMAKQQPMDNSLARIVADLGDMMSKALSYTRTLVSHLYPPVLQQFGLPAALQWLADQLRLSDFLVTLRLKTQIAPIPEDQARFLFQSVRELLHNCQKYSHVSNATVALEQMEESLCVTVADEGIGFESDSMIDNAARENKGFGLFSIRERMLSVGGQFNLHAAPGKGTEVKLVLPLRKALKELPIRPPRRTGTEGLVRVIVADDHAMVREGICGVLSKYEDVEVVGKASDGKEAIELANRLQPDVVLMDVTMPGVDGIEATRSIKQKHPSMFVIGLSVHNSQDVEAGMKEAGASAFMTKESAVEKLYETIRAVQGPTRSNV